SNRTVYDQQFISFMCDFGEVCDNAENWFTCRFILLIAAPKINFSILQSFILYMTYYQFVHAQLYTSQTDSGALTQQSSRVKCIFLDDTS
ncbi:unnamed protein product, partial [Rotaria sp. Silwood2]